MKIRLAIIGLGRQGTTHLETILSPELQQHYTVVAVADALPFSTLSAPTQNLIKAQQLPFFQDYQTLWHKTKPSLVVIAIPNQYHFEVASWFLKHKCHVLKEKPLALTLPEARTLRMLAKKNQISLHVFQHRQQFALWQIAKQMVEKIGPVTHFSYHCTLDDQTPSWYWHSSRSGGGSWLNIGWHGIWLISWLLGPIAQAEVWQNSGGKRPWSYDADHSSLAKLQLKSGAKGCAFVSCVNPKSEKLLISGEAGKLAISRQKLVLTQPNQPSLTLSTPEENATAHQKYYQMFSHWLLNKKQKLDLDIAVVKTIATPTVHYTLYEQ